MLESQIEVSEEANNNHILKWCQSCGRLKLGLILGPGAKHGPTCTYHIWMKVLEVDVATREINIIEIPSNGETIKPVTDRIMTGASCPHCGHLLVRDGSGCGICINCGSTGGCS